MDTGNSDVVKGTLKAMPPLSTDCHFAGRFSWIVVLPVEGLWPVRYVVRLGRALANWSSDGGRDWEDIFNHLKNENNF
jgi:hypothetical protein